MSHHDLIDTIEILATPGRGILAADESTGTIGKRLASIDVENTEENRLAYRRMLFNTPNLEQTINGVILFEETLGQTMADGTPVPEFLSAKGILPGIKVDKGLVTLPGTDGETVTQGLDGLDERLKAYKAQGARFAKWRNVYTISDHGPSLLAMKTGAHMLARYAACCQTQGIVPIVEPEILMVGEHSIEMAAETTEYVLQELFESLFLHQVALEAIVLKPSMVIAGSEAETSTPEEVAEYTLSVFRNVVPASVPTINFLSGGQTPEQATANLQAMNALDAAPWNLSYSYGRALQAPSLEAWGGKTENITAAQAVLANRAHLNALANLGDYSADQE